MFFGGREVASTYKLWRFALSRRLCLGSWFMGQNKEIIWIGRAVFKGLYCYTDPKFTHSLTPLFPPRQNQFLNRFQSLPLGYRPQLQRQSGCIIGLLDGWLQQLRLGVNNISMQQAERKYNSIITQLQKEYSQHSSDEKMLETFKSRLAKEFRLQVTSDCLMEQVLRKHHKKVQETLMGSDTYPKNLAFIDRLNELLFRIAFISRREYMKLKSEIHEERNSPANQWLEEIIYLRYSDGQHEFRYEFLMRYCGLSEEATLELLEDGGAIEEIKACYDKFFRRALQDKTTERALRFIDNQFSNFEAKTEMLSPQLIKDLDSRLGREVGGSDAEVDLNKLLLSTAEGNTYANDPETQQRLEDEVKLIEKTLQKFSGLNIIKNKGLELRLGKFGSLTSGFAGLDADLDLTILTNCYINELEFLRLLNQFLRKEYKSEERGSGRRVAVELIGTANTPLIQLKVGERGRIDLKIDIIVNNILGVINSKFLHVYSQVRWIKNLGLLVKLWGKAKGVVGKSMLSSYAIVLMLIHYLIKTRRARPILDHRLIHDKPFFDFKRVKQTNVERFRVYYEFKEDPREVSTEERVNYHRILTGFMKYYAEEFWQEDEKTRIITVDQSTDRPVDAETALTIKDPFDAPHNPGRVKIDSREFLVQKFKEAHELLKSGKTDRISSLFA